MTEISQNLEQEKSTHTELKDPLSLRIKMLMNAIRRQHEFAKHIHPIHPDWYEQIESGISMYRYQVREQMTQRSMDLPEANWEYNNNVGIFFDNSSDARIALVLQKNDWRKYIHAYTESSREIIASLPNEYHYQTVMDIEKLLGEKLGDIKGGYMYALRKSNQEPQIFLTGTSQDYGRADHWAIAHLLNSHGLNASLKRPEEL